MARREVGQVTAPERTHVERRTIALRNKYPVGLRIWGMLITVTDDPDSANNITWELKKGLSSNSKADNDNWQEFSSGGGTSYTFGNGIEESGGVVSLGGTFTQPATLLEVGNGQYFDILAGGVDGPIISWGGDGTYAAEAQIRIGSNNLGSLQISEDSFVFHDDRVGSLAVGMEYSADLGANFANNPRSIPDVGFVTGTLAGYTLPQPTAGEDGYVPVWDNGSLQWILQPNNVVYSFGSGLTESGGLVTAGGTATQNISFNSDVAGTRAFSVGISTPFSSVSLRASNAGNTNRSNVSLTSSLATLSRSVGANSFSVGLGDTGGIITDQLNTGGLQNFADYSANFTARNLVDYGFVTTHIGTRAVDTLVTNPTVSQNGYVIAWNNTNLEYELVPQSGGGVSFGTSGQLPFVNSGATNFSYEAGFEYSSSSNLFIAPALQLNNASTAGGGSITVQSSDTDANLTLNAKGGGTIIAANQFFQVASDFVIDGATGEITTIGDILFSNTGDIRIQNMLEVSDIFNLMNLVGTDGHSSNEDGFQLSLTAGNAYSVSGNGDGGNTLIQSGQRRAAGAGLDGNIVLNTWNGNLAFAGGSPDFEGGQRIIYIQDSVAQPSASPTDGMFLYSVNGELQVLNETGPALSLSGRATILTESGATVTLTEAHRGAIVKLTNNNPTVALSALNASFQCSLLFTGTGAVSFSGFTNFFSVGGGDQIIEQYGMCYLLHESSNNWYAKGDLA
jgi:hypothetical protein